MNSDSQHSSESHSSVLRKGKRATTACRSYLTSSDMRAFSMNDSSGLRDASAEVGVQNFELDRKVCPDFSALIGTFFCRENTSSPPPSQGMSLMKVDARRLSRLRPVVLKNNGGTSPHGSRTTLSRNSTRSEASRILRSSRKRSTRSTRI